MASNASRCLNSGGTPVSDRQSVLAPNTQSAAIEAPALCSPPTEIQRIGASSPLGMASPSVPARPRSLWAWNVRNFDELERRAQELGGGAFVVEGLLPKGQIALLVGDSGIGKSALLYQLAICVAAGVTFLGYGVQPGLVFYFDFENGLADTVEIVQRECLYLGLPRVPDNLKFWHLNDSGEGYDGRGNTILDIVKAYRPALAIIDSLSACNPVIEEKNSYATAFFQHLRQITRNTGTTFLGVHHLKKPSLRPQDTLPPLEDVARARDWLLQARGASALINASDMRLGVDLPSLSAAFSQSHNANHEEVAAVLRGFGRVRGEIGPLYIARVFDEQGEPLAYRRLMGAELLFNPDQEAAFARLAQAFNTGDARRTYGREDQATADFLKKLQKIGLVRKVGRGQFEKTSPVAERAECAHNSLNANGVGDSAQAGVERSSTE